MMDSKRGRLINALAYRAIMFYKTTLLRIYYNACPDVCYSFSTLLVTAVVLYLFRYTTEVVPSVLAPQALPSIDGTKTDAHDRLPCKVHQQLHLRCTIGIVILSITILKEWLILIAFFLKSVIKAFNLQNIHHLCWSHTQSTVLTFHQKEQRKQSHGLKIKIFVSYQMLSSD